MNKQSNVYTIIYASVMVIVVAAVLAYTALLLKEPQTKNVQIDAQELYKKYIVNTYVINADGEKIDGVNAFDVNTANQVKKASSDRELPVFVCRLEDGSEKYVIPMNGAGLWGPIWGYVSVDKDGNTIYGAYFAHQGETPGLGAEIEKPMFSDQYKGKHLFIDGEFKSIAVEKKGQKPVDGAEYVDAISGGTITSKGVQDMMKNSLEPYQNFFKSLK